MARTFVSTTALGFLVTASALSWNAHAESANFADLSTLGNGSAWSSSANESLFRMQDALSALTRDSAISRLTQNGFHGLSIRQRISGEAVETVKFQDYYQGIEVFGSMAFHHRAKDGSVEIRNQLSQFDLDVVPSLSAKQAVGLARSAAGDRVLQKAPSLKILPEENGSAKLVYWVKLRGFGESAGRGVAIDAQSGQVLANVSDHFTIAPTEVYSAKNRGQEISLEEMNQLNADPVDASDLAKKKARAKELQAECQVILSDSGEALMVNLDACQHTVATSKVKPRADAASKNAARNAAAVLEYYSTRHGRDSIDGKGSASVSVVHIGKKFANAYWNPDGNYMAYGDGDGVVMGDMTAALDVSGHEHTHGVVQASVGLGGDEVGLIAYGEPGALNEATADFFGKAIANDGDWSMGRAVFKDKSKAIRNLEDPASLTAIKMQKEDGTEIALPYPDHMKKRFPSQSTCDESNDMCWVHINSTVFSHALYLVQKSVGMEKTEKLYYLALTQYMNPRASFRSARDASVTACGKLYDDSTCDAVKAAFAQVGL